MTEMVQRVADAVAAKMEARSKAEGDYYERGPGVLGPDIVVFDGYLSLTEIAQAAMEAMRGPTDGMLEARFGNDGRGCWQDMIDAALTKER